MEKKGILLINLGTPKTSKVKHVRSYLKEFLSDPKVIDIHPLLRYLLLYLIILPFRSSKSAAAYRKIWKKKGSPLLFYSKSLANLLQKETKQPVALGMTYGSPTVEEGMELLKKQGCDHIQVLPLYPQFATSSTGAALDNLYDYAKKSWNTPFFDIVAPFYRHPLYISSLSKKIKDSIKTKKVDHILFSFHGLPERHILKSDPSGNTCTFGDCCESITENNKYCYRAHCIQTARLVAKSLDLEDSAYSISFQSRLGRTPWLKPYTDVELEVFPQTKGKNLAVVCPAFVTDCLETIEEIGIRGKKSFKKSGGKELYLIPCLNDDPEWAKNLAKILLEK